jgi:hypothetical protein
MEAIQYFLPLRQLAAVLVVLIQQEVQQIAVAPVAAEAQATTLLEALETHHPPILHKETLAEQAL